MPVNQRTVNINQIPTNEWAFVRGRVDWSRVASLIDGDELEREIQRAQSFGRQFMQQRPYTRMSIYDARVVDYLGNQKPETDYSVMDRYLAESFFQRRNRTGWCFEGRNTSSVLPEVGVYHLQNKTIDIVNLQPGQELAQGSDVILAMRCYAPRTKGYNKGISLREVYAVGELELRTPGGPNGIDSYLSSLGITINRETSKVETVATASIEPAPEPVSTPAPAQAQQMPYQPAPTYGNAPVSAPMPAAPMAQPYGYTPQGVDPAMQAPIYGQTGIGLNAPVSEDEAF